jgi:stage IV sporulation protein FB
MSSLFPSRAGGGLRFTLFGIPVTISLSVVLLLGFLGFRLGDPVQIVLWVVIGITSILLHELGHAVAARAAGSSPEIALAGLGGATTYRASSRTQGRGWSLAIGLAGPAVGIVLGLLAVALGAPCCAVTVGASTGEFALSVFVFVSLVWSVLNLLPILPLDGGQALAALLPGTPSQRQVRAAIVGTIGGAATTVAALLWGVTFGAIVLGLLTWENIRVWRNAKQTTELTTLAERGDLRAARDALAAGQGDPRTAAEVQHQAFGGGSYQIAAEVGEIALQRGFHHPAFAYNAACAWAQLGTLDRAATTLARALELGFDDREQLRHDPHLAPLHDHPAWSQLSGEEGVAR